MKTKKVVGVFVLCLFTLATLFGQDANKNQASGKPKAVITDLGNANMAVTLSPAEKEKAARSLSKRANGVAHSEPKLQIMTDLGNPTRSASFSPAEIRKLERLKKEQQSSLSKNSHTSAQRAPAKKRAIENEKSAGMSESPSVKVQVKTDRGDPSKTLQLTPAEQKKADQIQTTFDDK